MFTIFTKIWGYLIRVAFFHLKLPCWLTVDRKKPLISTHWSSQNPISPSTRTHGFMVRLLSFFHPLFVPKCSGKPRQAQVLSSNELQHDTLWGLEGKSRASWETTFFSVRSVRVCDEWPLLEGSLNINVQGLKIMFFLSTCLSDGFYRADQVDTHRKACDKVTKVYCSQRAFPWSLTLKVFFPVRLLWFESLWYLHSSTCFVMFCKCYPMNQSVHLFICIEKPEYIVVLPFLFVVYVSLEEGVSLWISIQQTRVSVYQECLMETVDANFEAIAFVWPVQS